MIGFITDTAVKNFSIWQFPAVVFLPLFPNLDHRHTHIQVGKTQNEDCLFQLLQKISVRAEPIYLNEVLKIGKNAPFVSKLFECDVKGFKTSFQVTNLL